MRTFLYTLLFLFVSTTAFAQDILTSIIEWNSSSTFSAHPGTLDEVITKVISSPTQITWYDTTGVAKETMEISGSEGSWTNVSNDGSILFRVNSGEYSGIVQFIRSNGTTKIRIQIVNEDDAPIYELSVTDIQTP